ncbi:hypothetical protein SAMN05444128_1117 [Pontibacter indicus]|uniref:Uncharacterized protein n=1 Tax=Pontibacter indicus TaxID=1317125 RepID=A0A1R3WVB9_9BACT|nr:hypothetical protein SAMN05444128_1117 [Pontibacter indicus]
MPDNKNRGKLGIKTNVALLCSVKVKLLIQISNLYLKQKVL